MYASRDIVEKKFNTATQVIIGEVQLKRYGEFLDKHDHNITKFESTLWKKQGVRTRPITVQIKPQEDIGLLKLVQSDNKLLSRILVSLASVCDEICQLVSEAKEKYYNDFAYYGEFETNGKTNISHLTTLFSKLQEVQFYVTRAHQVIKLMLRQLCAILGKRFYSGSATTSFPETLDCIAELLVVLLTLDALLNRNIIKEHWNLYRRHVRTVSFTPNQFDVKRDDIRLLDRNLVKLQADLLEGTILKSTLEKSLDEEVKVSIKSCNLPNEIALYIHQMLSELEKDDENISFTQIWLQTNALFVLLYEINGTVDKKILKRLLDCNKKVSACTVSDNILWYPEQFLLKHIPSIDKHIQIKTILAGRKEQITQRTNNLSKDAHHLCIQACSWVIEIQKLVKQEMNRFNVKNLQEFSQLLVEGMKLVKKISEFVKWITNMHADEGRPMTKSVLLALCKLVEVLKCFQFIFHRNILPLSYVILLISQHVTHKALNMLTLIKKSFTQDKSYKEQQLDVLSALVVAERALKGSNTDRRLLLAKLALSASGLQSELVSKVRIEIERLEVISNVTVLLNTLSNCSFLYWHEVLFPVYFTKIVETKVDMMRCYLFFTALSDCTEFGSNFKKRIAGVFNHKLLEPLNQCVEANLRLQTHLHLQLPALNPFQDVLPKSFVKTFPILFGHEYLNIRQEVEHYLSTMFYNLTTVVLHDWRTYGEMRQLAFIQYGLKTVEDSLPVQTLEQGLDVLEIMRKINVFVTNYLYNLNNQVFIEERSSDKHLNSINISHVANSIRTHGIGIMSTTVNFTYQFLQKKFFIFSQFMFDEQIKSRLLKDLRYFTEHKTEFNQLYPYARAERFNTEIRKLGLIEEGSTYLDLFRKLITQIGNAMGYIRLIRSGGKRCVADATCFMPDLKSVEKLNNLIDEAELDELPKHAAGCLKRDINILVDNFEEATEYFKLLINVFAPPFRDPQNIHLRNFYIIVPPLTINFVEHSLNCKERLNKKNREGAAFTDDGFAMGLAYIIELLDQESQLKSLHWFQSVQAKLQEDRRKLEEQKLKSTKDDVKLQQTQSLTEKRIKANETEFKLLYYSFSSARIFFQT